MPSTAHAAGKRRSPHETPDRARPARGARRRPGVRRRRSGPAHRGRADADHAGIEVHPRRRAQGVRRLRQGEVERHREGPTPSRPARRSPTAASWSGRAGPTPTSSGAGSRRCSRSWPSRSSCRRSRSARRLWDSIPASIGKPRPIPLKDRDGFWVGTALEPYGLVYHPVKIKRLGIPEPKEWDDLLNPKLKGEVAQCAPTRSSSSNATYEVILSMLRRGEGVGLAQEAGRQHRPLHRAQPGRADRGGQGRVRGRLRGAVLHGLRGEAGRLRHQVTSRPRTPSSRPEPMAILAGTRNPRRRRARSSSSC